MWKPSYVNAENGKIPITAATIALSAKLAYLSYRQSGAVENVRRNVDRKLSAFPLFVFLATQVNSGSIRITYLSTERGIAPCMHDSLLLLFHNDSVRRPVLETRGEERGQSVRA